MKNFKQIAEDCLAGKLSGTFVLRNGETISSKELSKDSNPIFPYIVQDSIYYTKEGNYFNSGKTYKFDIIDFIPDMKKEQITIDIPEGKVPVTKQTENGVIITWEEKELTYTELLNEFRNNLNCIHVSLVNSASQAFFKKVEVLRKLTNIRNYFGGDKPTNDWLITIDSTLKPYVIKNPWSYRETSKIYFDTKEHAQAAINMLGDELKYLFEPW